MKKLTIIFVLIMVFSAGYTMAKEFAVDIAGDAVKDFVTEIDFSPGQQVSLDIYLSDISAQNSVGVWFDWTGSTDLISYVSGGRAFTDGSEGLIGPWLPDSGYIVNEPAGPGTVTIGVGNLGGAFPDGDGDLIIGRITLECTGEGDAIITIGCLPGAPCTFPPGVGDPVPPTTLTIHQTYIDTDNDGVQDYLDTCPLIPNGPELGICYNAPDAGNTCLSTDDCEECCMNQEDYVCNCKSDFNCDLNVDAIDVSEFLNEFGRSQYLIPCANDDPCIADYECDADVDADDARQFLSDFSGRFFCGPSFCLSPCITCIEDNFVYACTYE